MMAQLVAAYDELENNVHEVAQRGGGDWLIPRLRDGARVGEAGWPLDPGRGMVEVVAGDVAAQVALAASAVTAAVEEGRPVGLLIPEEAEAWLVLVLLAHGEIPLLRLGAPAMRDADWPLLAQRLGELVQAEVLIARDTPQLGALRAGGAVVAWAPSTAALTSLRRMAGLWGWSGHAVLCEPGTTVDRWVAEEDPVGLGGLVLDRARLQLLTPPR